MNVGVCLETQRIQLHLPLSSVRVSFASNTSRFNLFHIKKNNLFKSHFHLFVVKKRKQIKFNRQNIFIWLTEHRNIRSSLSLQLK